MNEDTSQQRKTFKFEGFRLEILWRLFFEKTKECQILKSKKDAKVSKVRTILYWHMGTSLDMFT